MSRTLLAALVGILLVVPVAIVGDAVGFGSLAWIVAILAVGFVVSLVDREGFYGVGPDEHLRGSASIFLSAAAVCIRNSGTPVGFD